MILGEGKTKGGAWARHADAATRQGMMRHVSLRLSCRGAAQVYTSQSETDPPNEVPWSGSAPSTYAKRR